MKIFNKFIWSKKEPSNKNDIWFDGSTWRMYTEEAWQSFTLPVDAADKVAKVIENASEVYQEKLNAGYGIIIEGNTISVDDSVLYDDSDVWEAIETLQQNKVEQIQLNDYVPLDRYSSTSQVLIHNISELNSTKLNKTDVATINGQSLIEGGNVVIEGGDSSHNIGSIDLFEQIIAQKQNHNLTLEDKEAILNGKVITTSAGNGVVPTISINSMGGDGVVLIFHFNERLYEMFVMWTDTLCYINGVFSFTKETKLYADTELSETSENAVQNKVVTEKLAELSAETASKITELQGKTLAKDYSPIFDQVGYFQKNLTMDKTTNAQNTGYVNVKGYYKVYCNCSISSGGYAIAFFDENKNFISGLLGESSNNKYEYIADVPNDAYYAIFSNYGTWLEPNATIYANADSLAMKINDAVLKSSVESYVPESGNLFDKS